ncbi:MAG: hypothetical protein U1E10_04270, partial [Bdellovibrionales bacterium]|nr:hypothetical protein [Bdellovibrionales bacterium]
QFEPHSALFAGTPGQKGLEQIQLWSKTAASLTLTTGCTIFEIGDGQGSDALQFFREAGWTDLELVRDLSDRERMIVGVHHG